MNNLTSKTESLPKTGHVNEVCKEWLVREDGALAYKLQSQEINDFYKGNRYRNAVVREDFPTALHEQIKEAENAEKQSEAYRRRLHEQEEHDKRVAKEIADKLERDLRQQRQRELLESEVMAQQMQEMYVNLPPVPPPAARDRSKPPPPRPAKASIRQHHQGTSESPAPPIPATTSSGSAHHSKYKATHNHQNNSHHNNHQPQQAPQPQTSPSSTSKQQPPQFPLISSTDCCYVDIMLAPSASKQSPNHPSNLLVSDTGAAGKKYQSPHSSSSSSPPVGSGPSSAASSSRRNIFEFINTPQAPNSPSHTAPPPLIPSTLTPAQAPATASAAASINNQSPASTVADDFIEYADVADSIRRYDISPGDAPDSPSPKNINKLLSPSSENLLRTDYKFQKLSPEKYDQLMGNRAGGSASGSGCSGSAADRHMQEHADDIEIYVDPCDYASLQEIGLPMEEIKEISKKLKQEQKDELLARRLQEMESNENLTLEERDRLLAIEAQDKELAKMLQEREKLKAKRAKEKARLRKSQQQQKETTINGTVGLHNGPLLPLPLPQDGGMSTSTSKYSANSSPSASMNHSTSSRHYDDQPLDLEAYSTPIDVINSQVQRPHHHHQNGLLTNGSLTRSSDSSSSPHGTTSSAGRHPVAIVRRNDDDLYTLPVDSCRPGGQRPASLHIGPDNSRQPGHNNSLTRSENYSLESHDSLSSHHDLTPSRMNYSKSAAFDHSSSPTPPYMPIQGTRRSNSNEERKKRSKDNKCTHQ